MINDTHISPDINHGRTKDTDVGLIQHYNWGLKKDGDSVNRILDL